MKDRFKFRFWFKDTQEMIYSENFNDVQTLGQWLFGDRKDVVKMQCTGLRDKHNNLIYEGDIIKYYFLEDDAVKSEAYEIKYSDKQLAFILKTLNSKHEDNFITYGFNYEQGSHSVVGNIFENPLDTTKN